MAQEYLAIEAAYVSMSGSTALAGNPEPLPGLSISGARQNLRDEDLSAL